MNKCVSYFPIGFSDTHSLHAIAIQGMCDTYTSIRTVQSIQCIQYGIEKGLWIVVMGTSKQWIHTWSISSCPFTFSSRNHCAMGASTARVLFNSKNAFTHGFKKEYIHNKYEHNDRCVYLNINGSCQLLFAIDMSLAGLTDPSVVGLHSHDHLLMHTWGMHSKEMETSYHVRRDTIVICLKTPSFVGALPEMVINTLQLLLLA